jgi:hypothetical protein
VYDWSLVSKQPVRWDKANQRLFFDRLAELWNIRKPEDWYTIDLRAVRRAGGTFVSNRYGGSLIRGNLCPNEVDRFSIERRLSVRSQNV